jgi:peroxiredoxin
MRRLAAAVMSILAFNLIAAGADRLAEVDRLSAAYDVELEKYQKLLPEKPTNADLIRNYETWPAWKYMPLFVALADAQPDDEAAFRACQWILARTHNVGNSDSRIRGADRKAWEILANHHIGRRGLPALCLEAVQYPSAARERFLRELRDGDSLGHDEKGFATLALAELLRIKLERADVVSKRLDTKNEFRNYIRSREAEDATTYFTKPEAERTKAESIALFRETLDRYADVPVTITAGFFRDLHTLGEKAKKSLHALEHLTPGSPAPQIVGKDLQGGTLDLRDFRGRVVAISFWFTGCGPCMGLVPEEQRLLEKYKDRPFALLGVSTDESLDEARKTAAEHGVTWPCWFDGDDGPIARDYNLLHWPTICLLNRDGRMVCKDLDGEELDTEIARLINEKQ